MHGSFPIRPPMALVRLHAAATRITQLQSEDGAIPWFEDGPWDPWNHVECAMALGAMGQWPAAQAAYDHLAHTQGPDGAWLGEYGNALAMVDRDYISREKAEALTDANFCAYPAVGIAHYLMVTADLARVREWWPMIRGAIDFVLTLQRADGAFSWALEAVGTDIDDALLAGNASIAKSLECAIFLARALGKDSVRWQEARNALITALRETPEVFDSSGQGVRFAMDWYYPALSGALADTEARARLNERWDEFVDPARGCRCVMDEPWITVAETAELVMALIATGQIERAKALFGTLFQHRDEAGVFWMGWQSAEGLVWPREQPSWTQAAVILAADALSNSQRGSQPLVTQLGKR